MPSSKSRTKLTRNTHLQFEAIGTQWAISLGTQTSQVRELTTLITQRITAFDKVYSRFRSDSLVTAMSQQAGTYALPPDARLLIDFYRQIYDCTDGAVTPLVGQLLSDAGYDANYSLQPKTLHKPPTWDEILTYNYPAIHLSRPALLDFGAAGKGYLVDIIAALIQNEGVLEYCVDAGGDMRCSAGHTLQIGLEDPDDSTKVIGVAKLDGRSLCGSAGNRRKWASYHHIIDPRSLQSPQEIIAVWAVADTAMLADGMTTCLFFVEPDILQQHFSFEYVIMYRDRTARSSAYFPGGIFRGKEG